MGACAETIGRRRVRLEDVVVGLTMAKSGLMGEHNRIKYCRKGFSESRLLVDYGHAEARRRGEERGFTQRRRGSRDVGSFREAAS